MENSEWKDRKSRIEPGFERDSSIVHFTRTLLGMTAICGHYPVDFIGIPDEPEVCEECEKVAEEKNYDLTKALYFDIDRREIES